MAGYSGTPLLKKLGIKEGDRVFLRNAPPELPQELKDRVKERPATNPDTILLFAESRAALEAEFKVAAQSIRSDGMIWVAWPKKVSGIKTDLTESFIREHALKTPFVDVKVCAIDDKWSGLKFVIRKEQRTAHAASSKQRLSDKRQ